MKTSTKKLIIYILFGIAIISMLVFFIINLTFIMERVEITYKSFNESELSNAHQVKSLWKIITKPVWQNIAYLFTIGVIIFVGIFIYKSDTANEEQLRQERGKKRKQQKIAELEKQLEELKKDE